MLKTELKPYFKKIRKNLLLSYSRQHTKSIMNIIEQNAVQFFEENPTATFEEFKNQFGEPDNLWSSVFEMEFSCNPSENFSSISRGKTIFQIITLTVILCTLFLTIFLVNEYINFQKDQPTSIEYTIKTHELE